MTINNRLKEYIEQEILPLYFSFDKAHNIDHVEQVIEQSLSLAQHYDVDIDMVYTIAAYHDTGLAEGREFHHIASGKILCADSRLKEFFSEEQMASLAFLRDTRRSRALAFLLMTIPGTPKDLLSYFAGLTQLRLREWLTIVAVARIPSVIGSTCSGGAAGSGQYGLAAAVLVLTALFSGAGLLYYRRVCREESSTK